jgi:thioesterase-3
MVFRTEIKIRGYHLDVYGHVNNARWVELLEEARWRWLDQDLDLASWDQRGQGIAVVNLNVNYRRPAVMHDILEFRCWIRKLGGRSAVCRQEVYREATGERLVDADVTFVLFDLDTGRPRPMEGAARDAVARYHHRERDEKAAGPGQARAR